MHFFIGFPIVRKTNEMQLNRDGYTVVCSLPNMIHVGPNAYERNRSKRRQSGEATLPQLGKAQAPQSRHIGIYLDRKIKRAMDGQIIRSGIRLVIGGRSQGYFLRGRKGPALCMHGRELDLDTRPVCDCFLRTYDMLMRDAPYIQENAGLKKKLY